jgi:hypothetical protein
MVKTVTEDVIRKDQLVIEPFHSQNIGSLFSHPAFPSILPVEVLRIGHACTPGKIHRLPGEGIDVDMIGHFRIRQYFGTGFITLQGKYVDEHSVIRLIPEHDFAVRGETNAIRLFHAAKKEKKSQFCAQTHPDFSCIPIFCESDH